MSIHVQVRVGVEWVNNFQSDECHQNDLSYCDDQVVGFYDHMGSHGHIKVFNWGNDNAWETDFRHPDFGGDSLNWSDDVHFCMVNDHGGNAGNVVSFYFSKAHTNCSVPSTKMRLGRKNLKWLAALGCDAVLNTNADHIVAVWAGPMQGTQSFAVTSELPPTPGGPATSARTSPTTSAAETPLRGRGCRARIRSGPATTRLRSRLV